MARARRWPLWIWLLGALGKFTTTAEGKAALRAQPVILRALSTLGNTKISFLSVRQERPVAITIDESSSPLSVEGAVGASRSMEKKAPRFLSESTKWTALTDLNRSYFSDCFYIRPRSHELYAD